MAKSTIETLPPDVLERLQAWLRDPTITQLEATERLNELLVEIGEAPRSKSAVNRYSIRMDEMSAKIMQSREVADMYIGKLGNAPQGKVGSLVAEIIRTLAFNTALDMAESDEPIHPKLIKEMAWALEKIENATTINEKRQAEIEKRALEKAAKSLEAEATKQGLTPETIATLKSKFLGGE